MRLRMLELRLYFRRRGRQWLGAVFGEEPPNVEALKFFNAELARARQSPRAAADRRPDAHDHR